MTCQQVQTMLDGLTLPRLQAKKYTTLHSHLQSCEPCEHFLGTMAAPRTTTGQLSNRGADANRLMGTYYGTGGNS